MYFWNIESLKSDIVAERLAEKDRFKYALIYIVFNIIAFEYFQEESVGEVSLWLQVEAALNVIIVLVGTYFAYKANGGENGQDFLGRYFSISFVVSIRFSVLLFLMIFVLLMYQSAFGEVSSSPLEICMFLLWTTLLYANIVKHMRFRNIT
ncbi:hypothetical protein [Vibrio toranzoniae]|uniref:hypothetical protein n=1 Tax=Vibrio toranzoniae TaxID=1194427 RepID=UPI0013783C7C|nr:hypothetical protein [Vibrio toranzoniae]NAZ94490.1 hypothetical protein [Vibrio toranzoniae]